MKAEPAAADLLEVARATILAEVVPALAGPQRYAALMAANALAIASRDLALPDGGGEAERLAALLPEWNPPADPACALLEGNARLAAGIRAARFDEGPARAALLAHLRETVRARLAVSNPRALSAGGSSAP